MEIHLRKFAWTKIASNFTQKWYNYRFFRLQYKNTEENIEPIVPP